MTKEVLKIIKDCYKICMQNYSKRFSDSDWGHVYDLSHEFECIPGVTDVEIKAGQYFNYMDFNSNNVPYNDHKIIITTKYGIIDGYIRACSAGSTDDPFKYYDLVIGLWERDKKLNESATKNNYNMFIDDLSKADSFNDVKATVIKYVKRGILGAVALSAALLTFSMTSKQEAELMLSAYEIEIQLAEEFIDEYEYNQYQDTEGYIQLADETDEDLKEDWKLLTTDVLATVYNAVAAQCNKDVKHTASMFELDLNNVLDHKIIAMERTMMRKYGLQYGDLVMIKGSGKDGVYLIQDTMNKRFAGKNKIDILVGNDEHLGMWNGVSLYKLVNADLADGLKSHMLDAKNQKSIDKRLTQYKQVNESIDTINLLANILTIVDHITELLEQYVIKKISDKDKLNYSDEQIELLESAKYHIEINPGDIYNTYSKEILNKYTIVDFSENNEVLFIEPKQIGGNSERTLNRRIKMMHDAINNKMWKHFWRILVDNVSGDLHLMKYDKWGRNTTSKYLLLGNMYYFIELWDYSNILSIGSYYDLDLTDKFEPNENHALAIEQMFSFRSWPPKKLDEHTLLSDEQMVSHKFVEHWPAIFNNKSISSITFPLYIKLFETVEDFIQMAEMLITNNFRFRDEHNNIWCQDTYYTLIDELANDDGEITDETINNNISKKSSSIREFLINLLGNDTIEQFEDIINNKKSKHFYLRDLTRGRKLKNIYKKLNRTIAELFIKNNIPMKNLIHRSILSSNKIIDQNKEAFLKVGDYANNLIDVNEYNQYAKLFNNAVDNISNYLIDYETYNKLYKLLSSNDAMLFSYSRDFDNMYNYNDIIRCYEDQNDLQELFDTANMTIMIGRFYYMFARYIKNDNPNGWNAKDNANATMIYGEIAHENYYDVTYSLYDFNDSSLAIDSIELLYYFFYVCGKAVSNAYNTPDLFGIGQKSIKFLNDLSVEPDMNGIDFSALAECIKTVINDIYVKSIADK